MANKAKKWKQDVVTLDLPNYYIRVECPFQLNWSRDELKLLRRGWWLTVQRGDQSFTVNETAKITRSGFIGWRWDAFYFHFQLIGNFSWHWRNSVEINLGGISQTILWWWSSKERTLESNNDYYLKRSLQFKNVIIFLINTRLVHLLPPITIHPPCPTKCPRLIHSSTLSNASSTFIVSHGKMYFHFWFLNFDTIFPLPVTVSHPFKSTQVPDPPPLPPFPTRASSPPSSMAGKPTNSLVWCIVYAGCGVEVCWALSWTQSFSNCSRSSSDRDKVEFRTTKECNSVQWSFSATVIIPRGSIVILNNCACKRDTNVTLVVKQNQRLPWINKKKLD